jgi:hypothetical protein
MAVGYSENLLKRKVYQSNAIIMVGLVPAVTKCFGKNCRIFQWNGLNFDCEKMELP